MGKPLLVLAGVALLSVACAGQAGHRDARPEPTAEPTAEPTEWGTFALDSTSIDTVLLSDGDRTLSFAVRLPAGRDGCARNLSAAVDSDEGWTDRVVRVRLLLESRLTLVSGACPTQAPASVTLSLPAPLGTRDVVVNSSGSAMYTRDGAGALRHCGELGCHPAPTGCTPDSYEQAMRAADSPQHTYRTERGCDGTWLVLDLSSGGGPVCGDYPNSTACPHDSRTTRWFFHARPDGWQVVTATHLAGCPPVQKVEPAFPTKLCDGLPPVN